MMAERENRRMWELAHNVFDRHDGIDLESLRSNVLPVYQEKMQEHARQCRELAAHLRANGSKGWASAHRLADQFDQNDADAARLAEKLADWLDGHNEGPSTCGPTHP